MFQGIDPNANVNIPCPRCGQKSEYSVGLLQTAPRLVCASCGAMFAVNVDKLMEKLKAAQAKIDADRRRAGH